MTAQAAPAEAALSPVVTVLERAWTQIRTRHPEVPPAVIMVASGTEAGTLRKWGHFGAMRWRAAGSSIELSEVMVSGEGLARDPVEVFGTLLHEAAHAVAHVRRVQDTSRQGRYHNRRYAEIARQLGLAVAEMDPFGLADTTVPPAAAETYADVLDNLRVVLTLSRRGSRVASSRARARSARTEVATGGDTELDADSEADRHGDPGRTSNNNPLPCVCACPRKIRVSPTVLDAGPITCSVCGQDFEPGD